MICEEKDRKGKIRKLDSNLTFSSNNKSVDPFTAPGTSFPL